MSEVIDNNGPSSIQLFQNAQFKVRVVTLMGVSWFVAKDVAACIEHKDVSTMCKLCRGRDVLTINGKEYSAELAEYSEGRGNPNVCVISESGLYRILAKCNLPKCDPFESWVFDEVLPAIRKTGFYAVRPAPHTFAEALRAYADEVEARERAEAQRDEAIRTKSEIGSRREATAMNTASQKSKQVDVLETKLGYAEERAKFNPTRTVREWYADEKYEELFTNFLKVKKCERKEFFSAYERYAELAGRRMTDGNLIYFDRGRVYISLALVRVISYQAHCGLIAFGEDGSDGAGLAKFTVGTQENREYLKVRP